MSFFYKVISRILIKKLASNFKGTVVIKLPDNSKFIIGNNKNSPFIHIKKNFFFLRILYGGVSAVGYGYYKGEWYTNDLSYIIKLGLVNLKTIKGLKIQKSFFNKIKDLFFSYRSNTIKKSKKQISFHYDLGNDFYSKWLDKTMTYSSGIFNSKKISLENAQENKYKNIL